MTPSPLSTKWKPVYVSPVELLREAEAELWEAVRFYEEQQTGLGTSLLLETRAALHAIQTAPKRWPAKERGMRRYLLNRFPFFLHYRLEPARIRVVAFAHAHRRPGYWADRLQRP